MCFSGLLCCEARPPTFFKITESPQGKLEIPTMLLKLGTAAQGMTSSLYTVNSALGRYISHCFH